MILARVLKQSRDQHECSASRPTEILTWRSVHDLKAFVSRINIGSQRPTVIHASSENAHAWARKESKNTRNAGTGRSAVGAAVTGHKSKAKAGGGSLRALPSASASTAAASRKPVRASSTMLSVLSDKSSRFG